MEDQGDDNDVFSVDCDEQEDDPVEEMAWNFHGLQDLDHQGTPALQAIRNLCTKYDIKEPSSMVDAQAVIGDRLFLS